MKKILALILSLALVLGVGTLFACNKKPDDASQDAEKAAAAEIDLETATPQYQLAYRAVTADGVTGYALCRIRGAKDPFLLLRAPVQNEQGEAVPSFDLIRLNADGTQDDTRRTMQFSDWYIDNETGALAIGISRDDAAYYCVLRYKTLSTPTLSPLPQGETIPGTPVEFFASDDLRGIASLNETTEGAETPENTEEAESAEDAESTEPAESTENAESTEAPENTEDAEAADAAEAEEATETPKAD